MTKLSISADRKLFCGIERPDVAVELSDYERVAVDNVLSCLDCVSRYPITTRRTKMYLTMEPGNSMSFCNLKFSGRSYYIELILDPKDKAFYGNALYSTLHDPKNKKKFTRFTASTPEDVILYRDGIISSYQYVVECFREELKLWQKRNS